MTFLALIVSLLLQQFWRGGTPVHRDHCFYRWRRWLAQRVTNPAAASLLAVFLPAALLLWLMACLSSLLFGLLWILVAALVLAYTMGRGDYAALGSRYRGYCEQGDYEAAYLFLQQELGPEEVGEVSDSAALQESAHAALVYEGYQRWFPPLLYFLLLGPAGALLYRFAQLAWRDAGARGEAAEPVCRLRTLLDWLPSRLLALSFALTGDFVRCRAAFHRAGFLTAPARQLLHEIAEAAAVTAGGSATKTADACGNASLLEIAGLLSRSSILWLATVALLILVV